MTDLEARAEQLLDAMHAAWDDRLGVNANLRAALNVVRTEREMVPCDDCEASGIVVEADPPYDAIQCFRCKGTKSAPGELLIVGLIGGELTVDEVFDLNESFAQESCPLAGRDGSGVYRIIEREAPQ